MAVISRLVTLKPAVHVGSTGGSTGHQRGQDATGRGGSAGGTGGGRVGDTGRLWCGVVKWVAHLRGPGLPPHRPPCAGRHGWPAGGHTKNATHSRSGVRSPGTVCSILGCTLCGGEHPQGAWASTPTVRGGEHPHTPTTAQAGGSTHAHLAGAREELSNALEDGVSQGVWRKGDD